MRRGRYKEKAERAEEVVAICSAVSDAGGQVTLTDLYGEIDIEEAARFLKTTKGQLYNLTHRREVPFLRWGNRGVRFRRVDLIRWQDGRRVTELSQV